MGTPGFTADASLYGTYRTVISGEAVQPISSGVYPADYTSCYRACYNNCLNRCFSMNPFSKPQCVVECRERASECRDTCTRQNPPCVPRTVCHDDPASTDPRCQICV